MKTYLLGLTKNRYLRAAGIVFAVLIFIILGVFIYVSYLLPLPNELANANNIPTTKIYDRNGILLYEILRPEVGRVTLIPLEQIPKKFVQATLAAEDVNYYSHGGVDYGAIFRALIFNAKEGRIVSGASTITQQLVRNMLGTGNKRDYWSKAVEAAYAIRINNIYTKDKILELYLNKIYYGNISYGAESASMNYFGKHIYDLDLAEMSLLAGLPQSPSSYNPFDYLDRSKKRQAYVLDQMVKYGFINKDESDAAKREPIKLKSRKTDIKAPHFVHYVINQLEEQYGAKAVTNGGLEVFTTLDYNLQLKAEMTVKNQISRLKDHNVNNSGLVSMDVKTGQVLAWVGSADYFDESIDGAVDMITSLRQPGSAIKPFTYLLAFEKGWNPATVIYDIPTQFNTESGAYSPKNYDLSYHGPTRVRTALASSFNIPAVKTLDFVGIDSFIAFLRTFGIDTLNAPANYYGLALTLGGGEVRALNLASAYNVIANYGYRFDTSTILKVESYDNSISDEWRMPDKYFVLGKHGKENAYQIIDILKDDKARMPGFGEDSVLNISREAAVKTGTTRNFKDYWTSGFTPNILTTVWAGNADASPMKNVSGIDGAAPIWADFMEYAESYLPRKNFSIPKGLKEVEICSISGKKATDVCPEKLLEWFYKGEEPKDFDDYYKYYWVNKQTGYAINDACLNSYNKSNLERRLFIVYPVELQKWASEKGMILPKFEPCNVVSTSGNNYPNGYSSDYPNDDLALSGGSDRRLIIDSPKANDEYLLESTIPLDSQKVPLRLSVPLNTVSVEFFIDEKSIGTDSDLPFGMLWLPVKGKHLFSAKCKLNDGSSISSDSVPFFVK